MNTDTDSTSSDSNDENGEFTINVKKTKTSDGKLAT